MVSAFLYSYLFSLALWQITSIEKLNARANATHSHQICLPNDTSIIAKQKRLTIMVSAFFSVKYLRNKGEAANDSSFFIVVQR